MKDRLGDIWTRFGRTTAIDLSGTDVDGTPRPAYGRRESAESAYPSPAPSPRPGQSSVGGVRLDVAPDPVRAALDAMHQQMAAAPNQRGGRAAAHKAPQTGPTPPETSLEQTLFADLAVTRSKTTRSGRDYLSFASARQVDWQRRKRRKFLGIF